MPDDLPPTGNISETTPPNPLPFVIALAGFVLLAIVAFVFLRADNEGELVRPDRVSVVDDDTIRAVATDGSPCRRILRAQVDLAEDTVFVELVAADGDAGDDCDASTLEADITLPEPVGDRDLRPGVGRLQIPCEDRGSSVVCTADR